MDIWVFTFPEDYFMDLDVHTVRLRTLIIFILKREFYVCVLKFGKCVAYDPRMCSVAGKRP